MIVNITNDILKEQSSELLITILRKMGINFPLYCGGNGSCGKCLIQVKAGDLPITSADRQCLTAAQLESGWRLGCQAVIESPCTIELKESVMEQDFYVPSAFSSKNSADQKSDNGGNCTAGNDCSRESDGDDRRYGIAIDIGTTTLAMVLVRLSDGRVLRQYTGLNHQRSYGTDVMARIRAAVESAENAGNLQHQIQTDILEGIRCLSESLRENVQSIVIAGNTTMIHLLRGYDCSGLGRYPFQPVSLSEEQLTMQQLLGSRKLPMAVRGAEVTIFPGMSAFVGGDITAGLWACNFHEQSGVHLFLDLGTNAEMALRFREKLFVTSAAAGPAFEGGHLSCGIGSVPGAIRNVKLQYGMVRYETIGRRPPEGLCGTGMVACMAELLNNRCMDETGLLKSRYTAGGFTIISGKVSVSQQDIREFQKANAAIRAGLELLMETAGCTPAAVETLEMAGGFGCELDVAQAVRVGLIPAALSDKVRQKGNTVIRGLIRYMMSPDRNTIETMLQSAQEISLAAHPDFTEKYLTCMVFPEKINIV